MGEIAPVPLLILWDIEISLSSIQTSTSEPIFLTISFVSSLDEVGTPLISRQSRLMYCSCSSSAVFFVFLFFTLCLITYYLSYFTFVFFYVQPSQSNLIFFVTTQLV